MQVMLCAGRISAGITNLRRDGFLSQSNLPVEIRSNLQAVSGSANALLVSTAIYEAIRLGDIPGFSGRVLAYSHHSGTPQVPPLRPGGKRGRHFQWNVLPFGISSAPWVSPE